MNAQTLARQVRNVFSLPEIVVTINQILNSAEPNFTELEEVILHDPALTVKLLKLVNSPYYGFTNKIDSVSRAVAMLGLQELKNLVLGVAVTAQFDSISETLVDMNTFWYHSVVKGVLAKILAKHFKLNNPERFYIAGLLSSLGQLILFSQYPQQSARILSHPDQSDAAILQLEKELFGFDYAELGAALLQEWKLPDEISRLVLYQFDPLNENAPQGEACILHVAAKISNNIQPCHHQAYDINAQAAEFNQGVLEFLQLSPDVIQSATSEALLYPLEILNIIHPSASSIF
ncbi:HDOD domain-containing protein [Methylomonas sp. LL1]|uniref:HDOD domain-containing protein n=1 Tax=Methylomonas sp. LL1 TaxID=2785785 RepID=UPI0018C429F1|nr:HDOD domain-containing protein [Methylomonas sp. LL1]QPK62079.1 HDOD domain-containing protein [Methylomonas sp. LL1]